MYRIISTLAHSRDSQVIYYVGEYQRLEHLQTRQLKRLIEGNVIEPVSDHLEDIEAATPFRDTLRDQWGIYTVHDFEAFDPLTIIANELGVEFSVVEGWRKACVQAVTQPAHKSAKARPKSESKE